MSFRRKKKPYTYDPWDFLKYIDEMFEEIERNFMRELERFRTRPSQLGFGPIVYGYSITIGPDGKPIVREFGTVPKKVGEKPVIEREPLVDISETEDEIIVTAETPGVKKEDIRIEVKDSTLEIRAGGKFYKEVDLPSPVDPDKSKATYNNGVIEIHLKKLVKKEKGRPIRVE